MFERFVNMRKRIQNVNGKIVIFLKIVNVYFDCCQVFINIIIFIAKISIRNCTFNIMIN